MSLAWSCIIVGWSILLVGIACGVAGVLWGRRDLWAKGPDVLVGVGATSQFLALGFFIAGIAAS